MMYRYGAFSPFAGWFSVIVFVLLVVVVVWLVASLLVGRDRHRTSGSPPSSGRPGLEDAEAILRARFARGEITAEEYQQARRVLGLP